MKVMCINNGICCIEDGSDSAGLLIVGNIYTVIDSKRWNGYLLYELEENEDNVFDADCFVPLSDIDETELVNERETVNA